MKVKSFRSEYIDELDNDINHFLSLIDILEKPKITYKTLIYPNDSTIIYIAHIEYENLKNGA